MGTLASHSLFDEDFDELGTEQNRQELEVYADKFEAMFDDIQNYELPDELIDEIEAAFNELLCLKQENILLKKQAQRQREIQEILRFKKANEEITQRKSRGSKENKILKNTGNLGNKEKWQKVKDENKEENKENFIQQKNKGKSSSTPRKPNCINTSPQIISILGAQNQSKAKEENLAQGIKVIEKEIKQPLNENIAPDTINSSLCQNENIQNKSVLISTVPALLENNSNSTPFQSNVGKPILQPCKIIASPPPPPPNIKTAVQPPPPPPLPSNTQPILNTNKSIPPPPPPCQAFAPRFKTLFWPKINENTTGTVFDFPKPLSANYDILNKFPYVLPKKIPTPSSAKSKSLISHKREIAISSALRALSLAPDQIIRKLITCSADLCEDYEKLSILYRVFPEDAELLPLKHIKINDESQYTSSELFMIKLAEIPNLKLLVNSIYFKSTFYITIEDLKLCLQNWSSLCIRLLNNSRLKHFVNLVLTLGNEMNKNHPKFGSAKGFKIEYLNELFSIKSVDSLSLLELLSEQFKSENNGNPQIFSSAELALLQEISNASFTALQSAHIDFYKQFRSLSNIKFNKEFDENMENFVSEVIEDVENEMNIYENCMENVKKCHEYFLEKEEKDEEGRLMMFINLKKFSESHIEICKQKWNYVSRESKRLTVLPSGKLSLRRVSKVNGMNN
ncbi:GRID2IP [Blepharisma stoltei]|uniref:FH2 domain-containing protein n=1 Tax=Blepharisma stoltei TaxID=1481888 RepID=A0AAU9IS63_9CILI|nr:unnamed protein product [Blepharisma stoltei]